MSPDEPFQFATLVAFLQRFPHPMGERVTSEGFVGRLFEDEAGLTEVYLRESRGRVCVHSDRVLSEAVVKRLRHVFEFEGQTRQALRAHPRAEWLGETVALPVLRWDDSFAAMASTIIEQQTSWRNALRSIDIAFTGSRRRSGELALFPAPEEFLSRRELLEAMPITNRRKQLLLDLSHSIVEEPRLLEQLCRDLELAESRLCDLKGIGPWTARVFLSKRYGYRNAVPTNDVALQRAAAHFIEHRKGKLSEDELENYLSEFGELAGEAAHRMLIRWVLETYPTMSNRPPP